MGLSICLIAPPPRHAAGLLLRAPRAGCIDRLLYGAQQTWPLFNAYPQQHGGQQQMRAVSC